MVTNTGSVLGVFSVGVLLVRRGTVVDRLGNLLHHLPTDTGTCLFACLSDDTLSIFLTCWFLNNSLR